MRGLRGACSVSNAGGLERGGLPPDRSRCSLCLYLFPILDPLSGDTLFLFYRDATAALLSSPHVETAELREIEFCITFGFSRFDAFYLPVDTINT